MTADVRSGVFITADELKRRLPTPDAPAILDVRWQLSEPDGRAAYDSAHIPGAVYVSLEDELSDHTLEGRGRHPLPSGQALQAAARRWGLSDGESVVVYDDWNRAGSSRAWWVLRAAGLTNVRILDGGLAAWRAVGGAIESGGVAPRPGNITVAYEDLYAGAMPTLTAEQAPGADVLIDARAPERYRGESEPVDATAGHIPGARNLPSTALLSEFGLFRDDDGLAQLFRERGVGTDVQPGVYCGSGVTASVVVAALAATGRDAALFPGSWSQWSSDPSLPVARGDD
jgi:thiosulfate/3-mercaptopyruvate sulfurtransferase